MGEKVFNRLWFLYRYPVFRVGEVMLVAAVLFHAINGIRIFTIDFWPETMAFHRKHSYWVSLPARYDDPARTMVSHVLNSTGKERAAH
ncbi:MAG: hypothetical protein ABSA59_23815 [Terriglobia bacterium]|jgi:succinate dehydrogenase/fumarate reductase cytochrome b subunit